MPTAQRRTDAATAQVRGARRMFALVAVVAVLAVIAAAVTGPWQPPEPGTVEVEVPPLEAPSTTEELEAPTEPVEDSSGVNIVPILVIAALLAAALTLRILLRWVVARPGTTPEDTEELAGPGELAGGPAMVPAAPELPALRRGAAAASRALAGTGPPRDAIIAAWLELEAAAASSGVPRHPAQTPTELTTAVLAATAADEAATTELLGLYRRARFAADPRLDTSDIARAQTCLEQIAASWEQP